MSFFSARNITKNYAAHKALDNVSIEIPPQSIFGLLGPNGAGKTTLIRIINQIIAPDTGELFFQNNKLGAEHIYQIGYLPEERGLYKKMKVGEQALYLAQLKGVSKSDALKKLKYWFEKFDIKPWWNKKVEELSKGMQQKVQFIVTIIHEPKLLIFDEPFSGFDPINVNLLKDEILALRRNGSTIIFSTHNMASVEELCDNIALINNSKKILDGRVSDIRNEHKTNTFSIGYNDFKNDIRTVLPADFTLKSQHNRDELQFAEIQLPSHATANHLLKILMPHVSVHTLNEIIPTMNEIFINTVNQKLSTSKLNNYE
ncbi:MAG: ABC transporter ATP-binding protein [Lentimicrobiaceae bacterium]|nr:ABC transporter ATP-binding protein [Lentimicrobiaceae bacterium]